jgi:preprotein translocase subunit SecA
VGRSIEAEHAHARRAIEALTDRTEEGLEAQISERRDTIDAFFDSQRDVDPPLRPQKAAEELGALLHLPLRLTPGQLRMPSDEPEVFKKWITEQVESQIVALNVTRIVGAIEHRLGESLGAQVGTADWDVAAQGILAAAAELMQRQRERMASQVDRDLAVLLPREGGQDDSSKLRLLLSLSQGSRTVFDQRTHRQLQQVFARFSYIYFAARLLGNRTADDVTDAVLEHLEHAESALQTAWGQGEFERLGQNAGRLADFGPAAQVLGPERLNESAAGLADPDRAKLIQAIGSYVLNEVKRQLLLSAITELWVDYLTKVEALRVSIGLEAYAQRDPLVQYKGQASELFHQLLSDVRAAVIGRVFAYQPRRLEITAAEVSQANEPTEVTSSSGSPGPKKKRKRH